MVRRRALLVGAGLLTVAAVGGLLAVLVVSALRDVVARASGPGLLGYPGHTATPLSAGPVLVVSGEARATLYDPATRRWRTTEGMTAERLNHTATLLADGRVLVGGGFTTSPGPRTFDTTELYDPATGRWRPTGAMLGARSWHTATLLPDGRVLVVGGYGPISPSGTHGSFASAEIYDPALGRWQQAASLHTARHGHTATLLGSGQVLVLGGKRLPRPADASTHPDTDEVYTPATDNWQPTPRMVRVQSLPPRDGGNARVGRAGSGPTLGTRRTGRRA
ncbi:MAG: hypothetical protein M3Q65_18545 [Chloroflexota bacterium]|nr:hypothetical protein [Chloroflexota bacterium]